MTPELEQEYLTFVNNLGVERSKLTGDTDPHTDQMSFILLHMVLGMVTESGEVADLLKKHMAYSRPLDTTKLKDELGDLFFYLCGALIDIGSSLDEIIAMNMAKLRKRYPNGYTHTNANNRDSGAENEAQQNAVKQKPGCNNCATVRDGKCLWDMKDGPPCGSYQPIVGAS